MAEPLAPVPVYAPMLYDATAKTLTVTLPDGTKSTFYAGNVVTNVELVAATGLLKITYADGTTKNLGGVSSVLLK